MELSVKIEPMLPGMVGGQPFSGGTGPSVHIKTHKMGIRSKEGLLMSDYEILVIVLMVFTIVVTLMVSNNQKK